MEQLGSGWNTCGQDVESMAFDWGTIKILSETQVTGAQNFTKNSWMPGAGAGTGTRLNIYAHIYI